MKKIDQLLKHGYQIDVNGLLDNIFKDYKKLVLSVTGSFLLFFVFVMILIIGLKSTDIAGFDDFLKDLNILIFKSGETGKESIFYISHALNFIAGPFLYLFISGVLLMNHKAKNNLRFNSFTAFTYFLNKKAFSIVLFSLVFQLIGFSVGYIDLVLGLNNILSLIIPLLVNTMFLLVLPFILFENFSVFKAINYSVKLINQKPLMSLGLYVLFVILSFAGIIGAFIGVLFTMFFSTIFQYNYYCSVFKNQEKEILSV